MEDEGLEDRQFTDDEVLVANQRLLNSIASGSYDEYQVLCAKDMTCFEPETKGMLVEGLDFHKYYFDLGNLYSQPVLQNNITMSQPHVRWIGGSCAILSYTRLDQVLQKDGIPLTKTTSETRVWEVRGHKLVHVHFHRSWIYFIGSRFEIKNIVELIDELLR